MDHANLKIKGKNAKNAQKTTFAMILDQTRVSSAKSAWMRARLASALRHGANKRGQLCAAQALSSIKILGVKRAFELAPDLIMISIDCDLQIGLLSVKFEDGSRLHLPATTNTCSWKPLGKSNETLEDIYTFAA
jgi:hypothetical protein